MLYVIFAAVLVMVSVVSALAGYHYRRRQEKPAATVVVTGGGLDARIAAGLEARKQGNRAEAARQFNACADQVADLLTNMLEENAKQTRH